MADNKVQIIIEAQNKTQEGLGQIQEDFKKLSGLTDSLGGALKGAMGAFAGLGAAILSFQGLKTLFTESVDATQKFAGEVYKLGLMTGMTAEESSTFLSVAKRLGIEFDNLATFITAVSRKMGGVKDLEFLVMDETGKLTDVFNKFGIEIKNSDGTIKSFSDIFSQIRDKIKDTKNPTEQLAIATQFFRGEASKLLPLLILSDEKIKELSEDAKKYGLVLSGENMAAVREYTLKHKELDEVFTGLKLKIGQELLPTITDLTNALLDLAVKVPPAMTAVSAEFQRLDMLIDKAGGSATTVLSVIPGLGAWAEKQNKVYEDLYKKHDLALMDMAAKEAGLTRVTDKMFKERKAGTSNQFTLVPQYSEANQLAYYTSNYVPPKPPPDKPKPASPTGDPAKMEGWQRTRIEIQKNLDMIEVSYSEYEKAVIEIQGKLDKAAETYKDIPGAKKFIEGMRPQFDEAIYQKFYDGALKKAKERIDKETVMEAEAAQKVVEGRLEAEKRQDDMLLSLHMITEEEAAKRSIEYEKKKLEAAQNTAAVKASVAGSEEESNRANAEYLALEDRLIELKKKELLVIDQAKIKDQERILTQQQGALQEKIALAQLNADRTTEKQLQIDLIDNEIQRIALNKDLSDDQKAASTARAEAQKQELANMQTYDGAVKQGLKDVLRSYGDTYDKIREVAKAAFGDSEKTFTDVFVDAFKGQLKGIGDYWNSFWDSLFQTLSQALAKMVVEAAAKVVLFTFNAVWSEGAKGVLGGIGKILGYAADYFFSDSPKGQGTSSSNSGDEFINVYQGGLIPGYASGGDSPANDTVRAWLSPGEYVVPRTVMQGIASEGRHGDSILAHINKSEAALLKALGGSGTINPKTGFPEFFGWGDLLPFLDPGATSAYNLFHANNWADIFDAAFDPITNPGMTVLLHELGNVLPSQIKQLTTMIGGIVGNFWGYGGAAAGAGVGAKIAGYSNEDAFKAAAAAAVMSYIIGSFSSETPSGAGGEGGAPSSPDPASSYYNPSIDPNSPSYDPTLDPNSPSYQPGPDQTPKGTHTWDEILKAATTFTRKWVLGQLITWLRSGSLSVSLQSEDDNGLGGTLRGLLGNVAPQEYKLPVSGLLKAHNGYKIDYNLGRAYDEIPIMAQAGERVLSRSGNDAFEKLLGRIGQAMGQPAAADAQPIRVVVNNPPGVPLAATARTTRTAKETVVDIILEDLQSYGPLRSAFAGV